MMALALQMLHDEHAEVDRILGELAAGNGDLERARHLVCQELERHMRVEEQVFYPALERLEMLASFVARMRDQHARLREQIHSLAEVDLHDPAVRTSAVSHLNELLDAHIEEEEGRGFAYALEHLGGELDAIAVEMEHCREAVRGAYGVG